MLLVRIFDMFDMIFILQRDIQSKTLIDIYCIGSLCFRVYGYYRVTVIGSQQLGGLLQKSPSRTVQHTKRKIEIIPFEKMRSTSR